MASSVEQQRESGGNSRRRQWRCDQRRVNLPTVKRKLLLIFAVVVPLGLFLTAREAASWLPQRITSAAFDLPITPLPEYRRNEEIAPLWWRQLAKVARSKGWQLEAVSPDHRRMLVQSSARNLYYIGAVLDSDGRLIARLPLRPTKIGWSQWEQPKFSPDGTLVSFSQFQVSPTQVFDARTGRRLWMCQYWEDDVRFSADGRLAASVGRNGFWLLDARSGIKIRKLALPPPLPFKDGVEAWGFTRDGDFIVLEGLNTSSTPFGTTRTSQFWSWRLR